MQVDLKEKQACLEKQYVKLYQQSIKYRRNSPFSVILFQVSVISFQNETQTPT